ncbi:MAG: hypothetical protein CMM32_01715 [Rhodospirillaceae bacterium]|nr:hypothetical protein [Rhodospirillaceae bacterium]
MNIGQGLLLGDSKREYLLCWAFAFGVYLSLLGAVATTLLAGTHATVNELNSAPVIAQLPRESAPEDIEKFITSLDYIVGVAEVSILSERELHDLVEPWLSEEVLSELAFFPILVEITTDGRSELDGQELQAAIKEVQGRVLMNLQVGQQVQSFWAVIIRGLVCSAMLALLLSAVVLLVAQMYIFLNRELVNILRLLGATNSILIQEFRFNMLRPAIIGGCIGSIGMLGTILFILLVSSDLGINELMLSSSNFFLLFLVIMGFAGGPLLTWILTPTIIGRELTLLKKPRW